MDKITVSEAFSSIQGEGKTMGIPSIFIRLAGCNIMCGGKGTEKDGQLHNGATWRCDTIEVWKKGKSFTYEDLITKLHKEFSFLYKLKKGYHLIITGGEPMLQQNAIIGLLNWLKEAHGITPYVEIETNGTVKIKDEFPKNIQYNISPKLESSGVKTFQRKLLTDYCFILNSQFKFVVANKDDVIEVSRLIREYKLDLGKVWLMPAGSSRDELDLVQQFVVEAAMEFGCNYSHRLHITIWNQKTGK